MKKKKILLLSFTCVSALAVTAFMIGVNKDVAQIQLNADNTTTTLGEDELATCVFSAYEFDGKNDSRKFKYEMEGGKYMDGAIVYGDCDYQNVGVNLSEPLVLDNSAQSGKNEADFHIIFSARGLKSASFTFDVSLTNPLTGIDYINVDFGVKFSERCTGDLYTELDKRHYHEYSNLSGVADEVDIEPLYVNSFYTDGDNYTIELDEDHQSYTDQPFSFTCEDNERTYNAVAFMMNAHGIYGGNTISFTLKSLSLTYTC